MSEMLGAASSAEITLCAGAAQRHKVAEAQGAAALAAEQPGPGGRPLTASEHWQIQRSWKDRPFEAINCSTCDGRATVSRDGDVLVDGCVTTGSCEETWVSMHPEMYERESPVPVPDILPCGGFMCRAVVDFAGNDGTPIEGAVGARLVGDCRVTLAGKKYHENGGLAPLLNTTPVRPEDGFERYDGLRLEDEERYYNL